MASSGCWSWCWAVMVLARGHGEETHHGLAPTPTQVNGNILDKTETTEQIFQSNDSHLGCLSVQVCRQIYLQQIDIVLLKDTVLAFLQNINCYSRKFVNDSRYPETEERTGAGAGAGLGPPLRFFEEIAGSKSARSRQDRVTSRGSCTTVQLQNELSPIITATTESDGSLDQLMDPGLELVRPRRMCR